MVYRLVVLFIASALSLSSIPVHAIENGESALNDPRVVSTYQAINESNILRPGASAWLYAPRIVITCGHCVHKWELRPAKLVEDPSKIYVGKPGSTVYFGPPKDHVKASKIFVYETFDWYRASPGGTLSYKDDVAVIVLEKPLANVPIANLATKELLDNMIVKSEFIEQSGYGFQNNSRKMNAGDEPKKGSFQLIPFDIGMRTVNEFKQKWNRSYFQEDAVFVKLIKNGAAQCDGDSGSSFFYNQNGNYTHLGVMMGPIGSPNCGLDSWSENPVAAFRPIYLDIDMIKLAEKYVADNPYVEPKTNNAGFNNKTTITCVKGKATKKVTGLTPKCPKGFKKK